MYRKTHRLNDHLRRKLKIYYECKSVGQSKKILDVWKCWEKSFLSVRNWSKNLHTETIHSPTVVHPSHVDEVFLNEITERWPHPKKTISVIQARMTPLTICLSKFRWIRKLRGRSRCSLKGTDPQWKVVPNTGATNEEGQFLGSKIPQKGVKRVAKCSFYVEGSLYWRSEHDILRLPVFTGTKKW